MANRRQQELVIDVAKTLNQNIIASGELIGGVKSKPIPRSKKTWKEFTDSDDRPG